MSSDNYSEKTSISSQKDSATRAAAGSEVSTSKFLFLSQRLGHLREILSRPDEELPALREELCCWELDFRAKLDEVAQQQARLQDEIMRWQIATADADTKALRAQRKLDAAIARRTAGGDWQRRSNREESERAGESEQDTSSQSPQDRLCELEGALREFYINAVNPMTVAVASVELLSAGCFLADGDQAVFNEIQESLNRMLQGFRKFATQLSKLGVAFEEGTPGRQDGSSQEN